MNEEAKVKYHRLDRVEGRTQVKNSIVRVVFVFILVGLQFWWMYLMVTALEARIPWLSTVISYTALVLMLTIYSRHMNAAYRMFWMIVVAAFPVLGIIFYAVMGRKNSTKRMRVEFSRIDRELKPFLPQEKGVFDRMEELDKRASGASHYLLKTCGFPVYEHTATTFFPDAAKALDRQLEDLRHAEHFIFMEYYAIEEKGVFQQIFLVLRERAAAGVEVRVIYDDMGSVSFINHEFNDRMEAAGIHCVRFNPMVPLLNVFMNNRDHRKIMVIDGKIGYTGGYNLANEYFHITEPFGYWKDAGVRIEGDAVRSLEVFFMEMWNLINRKNPAADAQKWLPEIPYEKEADGFVQPYADSPLDDEPTGEEVYMNVLRTAKTYAYFVTPYLIITDELRREMAGAAKRGVDVRIITPGIPDKKVVYQETRSYYAGLVRGGVRIFEYTPGFCHAKMCVADDRMCTVGTINLDYRSLYLHFEDGIFFYRGQVVSDVKKDFDRMFAESTEVTCRYEKGAQTLPARIVRALLRILAPLM